MEAMEYEHLIRSVFNSSRKKKNGADADIYRPMERNHKNLKTESMYSNQDEREIAFQRSFVPVRNNIRDAILEARRKLSGKASIQELSNLDSFSTELNHLFYDKVRLDVIIDAVSELHATYFKPDRSTN